MYGLYEHLYAKVYNYISGDYIYIVISGVVLSVVNFWFYYLKKRHYPKHKEILWCMLMGIWMAVLLYITLFCRKSVVKNSFCTVFSSFNEMLGGNGGIWYDLLFNVFLFIPGGYLIRMKLSSGISFKTVFLLSLCIEVLQLATSRGIFEIADLLTNTLGGMIGIVLECIVNKVSNKMYAYKGNNEYGNKK